MLKSFFRDTCTFSILLTWSIASGEVHTLDTSPFAKTVAISDKQLVQYGYKMFDVLHRKYSVRLGFPVRVFSNSNILQGWSLEALNHPFQPISIVL